MKVRTITNAEKRPYALAFDCPGCGALHLVYVRGGPEPLDGRSHPRWIYNGDPDRPTFSPSLLVRSPGVRGGREHVCHSFIEGGKIRFLGDSTHALAGQMVELPDV